MNAAPEPFTADDVTLDGQLKLHVFRRRGGDTNLVLLHPSSGYGRMWEQTASHLGPQFNIIAPDQRGHGDSDRPDGEYSAQELARDLRALVDRLGLKRIVVGGHSLGGRVALVFAADYPELTQGLIMVGGPHLSNFYQTATAVRTVYTTAYKTMVSPTQFPSREAALAFLRELRPKDTEFALQHRIDYNMTHAADGSITVKYDPVRVAEGLTHQLIDLKKYAAQVRCPVAFIYGTGSNEMTPETSRDAAKFWSGTSVDFHVVDAGVSLQMENPAALANALTEFAAKRL